MPPRCSARRASRQKLASSRRRAWPSRDLGARYEFLKNDVDTARQLHASLLKQQLETAVNSQLAPSNVRVLERAEVPARPSKPNVPLNLTLGLLGGLRRRPVGAAFASEYFDRSVKSTEEAEELLHLPTLATIPNFALAHRSAYGHPLTNGARRRARRTADAQQLVVTHEPRSVVAEAFRTLRTAVLFSTPGAAPKLILVTSADGQRGQDGELPEPRGHARRIRLARCCWSTSICASRAATARFGIENTSGPVELPRRPDGARARSCRRSRSRSSGSSRRDRRRRILPSWSARPACAR